MRTLVPSNKDREKLWIVWNKANRCFIKHPRGGWTKDIDEAHGWHYKSEASAEGRSEYRVNRREDVRKILAEEDKKE